MTSLNWEYKPRTVSYLSEGGFFFGVGWYYVSLYCGVYLTHFQAPAWWVNEYGGHRRKTGKTEALEINLPIIDATWIAFGFWRLLLVCGDRNTPHCGSSTRVRSRGSPWEIFVGYCATGTGFSLSTSFFPCHYYTTNAPYSYWYSCRL